MNIFASFTTIFQESIAIYFNVSCSTFKVDKISLTQIVSPKLPENIWPGLINS